MTVLAFPDEQGPVAPRGVLHAATHPPERHLQMGGKLSILTTSGHIHSIWPHRRRRVARLSASTPTAHPGTEVP